MRVAAASHKHLENDYDWNQFRDSKNYYYKWGKLTIAGHIEVFNYNCCTPYGVVDNSTFAFNWVENLVEN
jgi:hypothetical protein